MKLVGDVVDVNFCLIEPGSGDWIATGIVDFAKIFLVVGTGKMVYFAGWRLVELA